MLMPKLWCHKRSNYTGIPTPPLVEDLALLLNTYVSRTEQKLGHKSRLKLKPRRLCWRGPPAQSIIGSEPRGTHESLTIPGFGQLLFTRGRNLRRRNLWSSLYGLGSDCVENTASSKFCPLSGSESSCQSILNQMIVKYIRIAIIGDQSSPYFGLRLLTQQLWELTAHSANKQIRIKEKLMYTYV
jgi:hypothetical protein